MLVSKDFKNVYLAVTKTGTHTIRDCLKDVSIKIAEDGKHPVYPELQTTFFKLKIDGTLPSDIDATNLNYYALWRDPVERFVSAVSFAKEKSVGVLMFMFADRFTQTRAEYAAGNGWLLKYTDLSDADKLVVDAITVDDVIQWLVKQNYDQFIIFRPQANWFRNVPNLTLLSFKNFNNSAQTLYNVFNGTTNKKITVSRLNASTVDLLHTLENETKILIRQYYSEDYNYAIY
jgi:hypothetical protein